MAKKEYKIGVTATAENIAALKEAGVEFILYEVNEVKRESGSFASTSNFATTEIILRPVEEMDMTDYKEQELKNYTANLSRNIPYKAEKIVRL